MGRVSRAGVVPVSFHLDHVGVIARTAADCGLLLAAMAGDDPRDPAAAPHARLVLGDERTAASPPRLGVLRRYFFDEAESETAELTEQALRRLRAAGAAVVDVALPEGFDRVHAMHRRIMAAEAAEFHRARYGAPAAVTGRTWPR